MPKNCTTAFLRAKAVVNINNGELIGYPCEFGVDVCDGRLLSIIVYENGGFLGLVRCGEIVIMWDKIVRIGADAILVDMPCRDENEPCTTENCPRREEPKKRCFPWF